MPLKPFPIRKPRGILSPGLGLQKTKLIVGGGFFAIGLLFTFIFAWGLPIDMLLDFASPRHTSGTFVRSGMSSMTVNDRRIWTVTYRYRAEGRDYEGISYTPYDDLIDEMGKGWGKELTVEYVPSHPSWSRLEGLSRCAGGYLGSFVLIFPILGMAFLLHAAWTLLRR